MEKRMSFHARNGKLGGRPPKNLQEEVKTYKVRLTKSQEEQFKRMAGSNGIKTMSGFLRKAGEEACYRGFYLTDFDRKQLASLDFAFTMVGRNLNESTRSLATLVRVPQLANEWQSKMELSADDLIEELSHSLTSIQELSFQLKSILAKIEGQNG